MRIYVKDNKEYISVTSVLSLMYPFDKKGFEAWAREKSLSPSWINRTSKRIGTKVHGWIEDFANGMPGVFHKVPIDPKEEAYHRAVENFLNDFEVIDTEFVVFNDGYGYAGRADIIVKDKTGDLYLTDIKTWGAWRGQLPRNHSFGQVREQLTMYEEALEEDYKLAVLLFEPDNYIFKPVKKSNKWKKWFKENNLKDLDYAGAKYVKV